MREQVAMALFEKVNALARLGRIEDGVSVYDEIVARLEDAAEPALRERVALSTHEQGRRAEEGEAAPRTRSGFMTRLLPVSRALSSRQCESRLSGHS